jgi:hypothetical protein
MRGYWKSSADPHTCTPSTAAPTPAPPTRPTVTTFTSRVKTQLSLAGFTKSSFGAAAQLAVRKAAARKARVSYLYVSITVVRYSTRRLSPGVVIDLAFATTPSDAAALFVSIDSLASTAAEQESLAADINAELQQSGATAADGMITVEAQGKSTRENDVEPPVYVEPPPATTDGDRQGDGTVGEAGGSGGSVAGLVGGVAGALCAVVLIAIAVQRKKKSSRSNQSRKSADKKVAKARPFAGLSFAKKSAVGQRTNNPNERSNSNPNNPNERSNSNPLGLDKKTMDMLVAGKEKVENPVHRGVAGPAHSSSESPKIGTV